MVRAGLPGDALDVVLAVGNWNGQGVVVRSGGNPHVIGRDGHLLTITLIGRLLNRRHATRIEHDTPVAGCSVGRLERRAVLDRDGKRRVRDGNQIVITVRSSGKSGYRERNGSEEAQAHQEAH